MTQKIIKVGSSAAVTISKKSLENLGLKIGDRVKVSELHKKMVIEPSVEIDTEVIDWTKKFIEKYRPALEALAQK